MKIDMTMYAEAGSVDRSPFEEESTVGGPLRGKVICCWVLTKGPHAPGKRR